MKKLLMNKPISAQGTASRNSLCESHCSHTGLRQGTKAEGSRVKSWKLPARVRTLRWNSSRAFCGAGLECGNY